MPAFTFPSICFSSLCLNIVYYLSSSVSAWKVLSTTVVKWRPRMLKVNFLGLSVRMISQFLTVKLLRMLFRFASVLGSFLYPMNSPLSLRMKYLGLQSFKCSAGKKDQISWWIMKNSHDLLAAKAESKHRWSKSHHTFLKSVYCEISTFSKIIFHFSCMILREIMQEKWKIVFENVLISEYTDFKFKEN